MRARTGGEGQGGNAGLALTGQMFSLGVPSSCTIRSIWWISELPGSSGLWASSSARMQPTALGREWVRGQVGHSPATSKTLAQILVTRSCFDPPGVPAAGGQPHPFLPDQGLAAQHPHHMSMLVVWVIVPSSSSGARYLAT